MCVMIYIVSGSALCFFLCLSVCLSFCLSVSEHQAGVGSTVEQSLEELRKSLEQLHKYVAAVKAGTVQGDARIGRAVLKVLPCLH